jgi:hypothetical protein
MLSPRADHRFQLDPEHRAQRRGDRDLLLGADLVRGQRQRLGPADINGAGDGWDDMAVFDGTGQANPSIVRTRSWTP